MWSFGPSCLLSSEPISCCAIDYIRRTLDGAQTLLNSPVFWSEEQNFNEGTGRFFKISARR